MARPQRGSVDLAGPGPGRGTNQSGMKLYNERLILSLVRSHGALSRGEVSRLTGLSQQASSVIIGQLEADGLLLKGEPQRGRIGQPSIPMSLNPEGAFSVGFKIGRRSADLILMDMLGGVRRSIRTTYPYAEPEGLLRFLEAGLREVTDNMTRVQLGRVAGLGIAVPSEMWSWESESGAPRHVLDSWRSFDIKAEAGRLTDWPVWSANDAMAACAAEFTFGGGKRFSDFLYIFFATLVGGGIVLDGELYPGRQGYAGAVGSLPVPGATPGEPARRLIQAASLHLLERQIAEAGGDPVSIWRSEEAWAGLAGLLDGWIENASDNLALAVGAAVSIIDFPTVVIDGAFPAWVRTELVRRASEKVERMDMQGVAPVDVVEGTLGGDARVLGAASLPLLADYARGRDLIFS